MKKMFFPTLLLALIGACDDAKAPAGNPEAVAAAEQVWTAKCVTCHGKGGAGDGEAGKVLKPPPRNFANSSWQGSVDDAHLRKIIIEGGAAVGLSANMSANPELADKPEVVEALVQKIRGFKS